MRCALLAVMVLVKSVNGKIGGRAGAAAAMPRGESASSSSSESTTDWRRSVPPGSSLSPWRVLESLGRRQLNDMLPHVQVRVAPCSSAGVPSSGPSPSRAREVPRRLTSLKLRKNVKWLSTLLSVGADYSTQQGLWTMKYSWEDSIIGGKLLLKVRPPFLAVCRASRRGPPGGRLARARLA